MSQTWAIAGFNATVLESMRNEYIYITGHQSEVRTTCLRFGVSASVNQLISALRSLLLLRVGPLGFAHPRIRLGAG